MSESQSPTHEPPTSKVEALPAKDPAVVDQIVSAIARDVDRVRAELHKRIVGQEAVIDDVLTCLFAGGHALLEGVPGLGKTLLVRSLSEALDLEFSRIQFTPDMMPADILGTQAMSESDTRRLEFRPGPIFANIVLADEVNRATPKTQSALLEAMQEHSVTTGGQTHVLKQPYLVLATQNPLEMEGTYPLPEAQLDRFLLKVMVPFPTREELQSIVDRTTGGSLEPIEATLSAERILEIRQTVREVPVAPHVRDYAIRVLEATHPDREGAPDIVRRFVRYGSSPRGVQACLLSAKVRALLDGRFSVAIDDIADVAPGALRHRTMLNFEGEAEGIRTDDIIAEVLKSAPKA